MESIDLEPPRSSERRDPLPSPAELFRAHATFVWRTLKRLGVREADVDDACQEVFVVACRRLESFEGRSSLRTWLYGIAIRVASSARRSAKSRPPLAMHTPGEGTEQVTLDTPYDASVRAQTITLLDRALDVLDDDKRAVFVLYEVCELTMAEVAEAVGCPLQTAYSRHNVAKEAVLRFMKQHETVRANHTGKDGVS